ncbi:MAG TPA: hypothetical protein VJ063_18735 [Verrucomicrobiae bacterium]|nr:hypothetical protein [Verrucomicrobiae bacterium]
MKRLTLIAACATIVLAWQPQTVCAGPVHFVANKTANLAHRAAYRVNRHVVQPTNRHVIKPARRAIVNHSPRPHH